jgi:hypothetical protein
MPTNLQKQIAANVAWFRGQVEARLDEWCDAKTPAGFRQMELELAALARGVADDIAAAVLDNVLSDVEFEARACAAVRQVGAEKYRNGGARTVTVTLLGGGTTTVTVPYYKPDRRGRRPGRRRKSGHRGEGGAGLYPTLAALGIWFGVSPALAGEVVRQVADSESVRPAQEALARRGIALGHKQTLRVFNHVAGRAVEQRERWFEDVRGSMPSSGGPLAGRQVVVGTDGGRCRMRVPPRCGRRRTKTRHRGYETPWQEPKVLVIYVTDARGRVDQVFRPVYDATMGNCDAVFSMLVAYLKALGVHEAARLVVVGDGAKWIWDRAVELAEAVGLPPERLVEVLDWYHAVETLHEIAKIPTKWTAQRRDRWLRPALRYLRAGRIDRLVQHIRTLAVGRRGKKVNSHVDYFERNAHRMQYRRFGAEGIPWGSGAVESAVRRIVNLRLKSPSKFWLQDNAEGMLLVRSYLKAGRFDDLFEWSLRAAAPWWVDEVLDPLAPPAEADARRSSHSAANTDAVPNDAQALAA